MHYYHLTNLLCLIVLLSSHARTSSSAPRPIRVLIVTGADNHDWKSASAAIRTLLERSTRFDVHVTEEPGSLSAESLAPYDVALLNWNDWQKTLSPWWGDAPQQALLEFVRGGKGAVAYHASLAAFNGWSEYDKLVGGTWRANAFHAPIHTFTVENRAPDHPIMRGIPLFSTTDELYHRLDMQPGVRVLATAFDDPRNCWPNGRCGTGRNEPLLWIQNYGKGHVFTTALGHADAVRAPGFEITLQRGTEWAATGKVTIPLPAGFESAR